MVAQIVLQQPVVTPRLLKYHGPHAFHATHPHRHGGLLKALVQLGLAAVPQRRSIGIHRLNFGRLDVVQKHIHGAHHIRVCVKSAARESHVARAVIAKALHPAALSADHAHWQTAAQGLAVGHHIGAHTKIFLRATVSQAKAQKHLIQNQRNAFFGTYLTQGMQPLAVSLFVVTHAAPAVDQGGIRRRSAVGVQRLQGVDQHAGDVIAVAQYAQGIGVHFIERQRVAGRRHRVARARLHIVPPAMVGTGEAHDFALAAMVARHAHRLHHRLGARHMEGDFLLTRNATQALHVIAHHRVVGAQRGPQGFGHGRAFAYAVFVKVQTKQVDAIGAGHIDMALAVHIGQPHALAGLPEIARLDIAVQHFAELVRHPNLADQLHVRHHRSGGIGMGNRQRAAFAQLRTQARQGGFALRSDWRRRTIGGKPGGFVVAVSRNPLRHALGHAQMPAQGRVLGQRQLQPLLSPPRHHQGCARARGPCQPLNHFARSLHTTSLSLKPTLYDLTVKE